MLDFDQKVHLWSFFIITLFYVYLLTGKMAVPPTYADLGKSAKDIFNKGYGNLKQVKRQFYKCLFYCPSRDCQAF